MLMAQLFPSYKAKEREKYAASARWTVYFGGDKSNEKKKTQVKVVNILFPQ